MGVLTSIIKKAIAGSVVAGGWYGTSKAVEWQGDYLRAYYGDKVFASNYESGLGTTQTGVNILGIYGGISAVMGRPFLFGAGHGIRAAKAGGKGMVNMGRRAALASAYRRSGHIVAKRPFKLPSLNPANWSVGTITASQFAAFGGGLAFGNAMPRINKFPIMEAGTVQAHRPVFQRLNYSTMGLTTALRNKQHRTLKL